MVKRKSTLGIIFGSFFHFVFFVGRRRKFKSVLADPEKKAEYTIYGVVGIVLGSIALVISILCGVLGHMALESIRGANPAGAILGWIFFILVAVIPVYLFTYGLQDSIWQTRLDKKTTGKVGIVLNLLAIVAFVVSLILIFTI